MTSASPLLDLDRIRRGPFVRDVEWHDVITSTNDRGILATAETDTVTPLLILAGRQTAGRGRGRNLWWSGPGALTCSLVLDPQADLAAREVPPISLDRWPRIALTAGVALCDVLQHLAPQFSCEIKWPNDVLLAGKKLAGILIESPAGAAPAPRRLVIGMGMNANNSLAQAPPEIQAAASSLCDALGGPVDATQLLIDWLARFSERLDELSQSEPGLPARWRSLCALAGKIVELQSGSRIVRGPCRGIDAEGALIVETAGGPQRLYAGAVVRVVGCMNHRG